MGTLISAWYLLMLWTQYTVGEWARVLIELVAKEKNLGRNKTTNNAENVYKKFTTKLPKWEKKLCWFYFT